jgi:hypothetical protein
LDTYKIAVELMLAGGLAAGLTAIAGQLTGIHGQVNQIHGAFQSWGTALGAIAAVGALGAIAAGVKSVFEETEKLSTQLTNLKQLGVDPDTYKAFREKAIEITSPGSPNFVPGSTEVGNHSTSAASITKPSKWSYGG